MLFWLAQEQARANVLLCKVLRIIHRTIKIQMSTQDCSHKNVWDIRRRCGFLSKHSWIPGLCVRGPALFHLTTFRFLHQIQAPPELGSGATGAGVWELYPWASGCSKNSSTTWAELGKNFDSSTSSRASFAQLGSCHWTCQVSTNDISYYYVIRIYIYIIYIHTEYMYIYIYIDLRIISKTVLLVEPAEPSSLFWKLEGPAWASSLPAARIHYCAGQVWRSYSNWHNK